MKKIDVLGKALSDSNFGLLFSENFQKPITLELNFFELIQEDSDVVSGVETVVNAILKNRYDIVNKNNGKLAKNKKSFLVDTYNFDIFIRSIVRSLVMNANAFVYPKKRKVNGVEVILDLELINPSRVEIKYKDNGKIDYYEISADNKTVQVKPKDMIHLKIKNTFGYWGESPFRSVKETIINKRLLKEYLGWLIKTNQFRTHVNLKEGDKNKAETLVKSIRALNDNPYKMLVTIGEVKAESLRDWKDLKELRELLSTYSFEINKVLKVTPIQSGIIEGSNRSNAEIQVRYDFNNNLIALQQEIEDTINTLLLPVLIGKNYVVRFNITDFKNELDIISMAEKLYLMGADVEKLNQFILDRGVNIPEDLFQKQDNVSGFEQEDKNSFFKGVKTLFKRSPPQNSDSFPSRRKKDSMSGNDYGQ